MDERLVDLREQQLDLLERVYDALLRVHFPVPGELDDLETMRAGLQSEVDGLNPELHVLVLLQGSELAGCTCYEYYPRGNHCLISYVCVSERFRRMGIAKRMLVQVQLQLSQRAQQPLAAIFAETHAFATCNKKMHGNDMVDTC